MGEDCCLPGVVEDDAEGSAVTAANRTDAMANVDTMEATSALNRPPAGREDDRLAPLEADRLTSGLCARTLLGKPGIDVILLGGKLHPAGYTLPQPLGASDLKFLVANKAFVEVEGVHHAAGATTTADEDARFKHDLLQHAMHKTVVAPASRAGLVFAHRIAVMSEIDCWITTPLDDAQRDSAVAMQCEIVESQP